ncbi:hypothetical protein EMIT0196MI5_200012 [Pseudomonas sp. IT-196MI5]|uniref:hypothetical protein n=1 Tax=unclassified Pseudomonas TaxID=196821 RepID=UPI0039E080B0
MAVIAWSQVDCNLSPQGGARQLERNDLVHRLLELSAIEIRYTDDVSFSLIARDCQNPASTAGAKFSQVDIRHGGGAIRIECSADETILTRYQCN